MTWFTNQLREETRQLFEKRYGRTLSDMEVEEIARNLAEVMDVIIKFKSDQNVRKSTLSRS